MAYYNKGSHSSSSNGGNRGRPYALMLLLAFGAALLGVMVLHKLRERRIYNLLVKEKDRDLLSLQLLLQKERDQTKEMKRKNEEMKAKIYSLRSQKMELDRTLQEMKSTMDSLKEEQKVMESALEEKQNEIRMLQVKESDLRKENPEVMALKEKLEQKEAEIEDLKHRLEVPLKSLCRNDSTNLPEGESENGKMAAQENIQTENEQPHGQFSKHGDGKGITNEDERKSLLIKPKNGEITVGLEAEFPDKKGNISDKVIERDEHFKRQETLQAERVIGGGNISEDYQDDGSNTTSREGQREQFENNANGEGQNLSLKQLENNSKVPDDAKRKHVRVSRPKGKRWRMIVKNRLLGNNGISESHGALNMRSRHVDRDEQQEMKDRIRGRITNEEDNERDEEEMGDKNLGKDKAETKVQNSESHDDIQDAHRDASQSEKQEESGAERNWSRRHINKVEKNGEAAGHEKTGMLREEHDEIKADTKVQEKEENTIENEDDEVNDDNISKESQPNFADEEDYKEKIDESEFRTGL